MPVVGPQRPPVAVIGAGPYGLSLAAHLAAARVPFRIFGTPMRMWRERMPRGMHLKSEPFATDLYDPGRTFTLARFCAERNLPYQPLGQPVPLDTFCDYGVAFQERFVPDLDPREVSFLRRDDDTDTFVLTLDDGTTVRAGEVVLAIGITHFAHVPAEFASLPPSLLSHSTTDGDPTRFNGRTVAVIGGGSSAVDVAVSLAGAGARPHLLTRRSYLSFHAPPAPRSLRARLRRPMSTVGPGWRGVMVTRLPDLFHRLPQGFRMNVTRRFLGPAPCWFTRHAFEDDVTLHKEVRDLAITADPSAPGATIRFESAGERRTLAVDHVIAATGFRTDLARLGFLDGALRDAIRTVGGTPVLDRRFRSTVPGLYFTGVAASNAFGPMLRFACGAGFAARRVTRALLRERENAAANLAPGGAAANLAPGGVAANLAPAGAASRVTPAAGAALRPERGRSTVLQPGPAGA